MTNIADIIENEPFANYMIDRLPVANRLFASGIIYRDPMLLTFLNGPGRKFDIPFWGDIDQDDSSVPVENTETAAGSIGTYELSVRRQMRKKNIGKSNLASIMSGEDPLSAIQNRLDVFWKKDMQNNLVSAITGVLASTTGAELLTDVANTALADPDADNIIAPDYIIDAQSVLGDGMGKFKAMIMHSKVYADLRKQNLITDVPIADQAPLVPFYQDMEVIVDDNVPTETRTTTGDDVTVYTTILLKEAAFAFNETAQGFKPVAVDEEDDMGFGEQILLTKRMFVLHPAGFDFTGTPAGLSPTNTELATGTNWVMKQDIKLSGFVALKTNANVA